MPVEPVPDGYHTVTPYLVVVNAAKLIDFLKRAFDGKETVCHTNPDGSIGHAEVRIGDSAIMMGEARGEWKAMPCAIYLYVPDTDAVYQRALQAGATSIMAPANQFYGDRHGGVKDPCGNLWWIATRVEDVSPEELKRRAEAHARQTK
jgi:PhnB protein